MPHSVIMLLLVVTTTADVSVYSKHANLNCWLGHGGINIDNSTTTSGSPNLGQLEARCDTDPKCYCVVLTSAKGKCYKRPFCNPNQCPGASGVDVFIKPGASPPPTPNPPLANAKAYSTTPLLLPLISTMISSNRQYLLLVCMC
jgi:hypothetical protein